MLIVVLIHARTLDFHVESRSFAWWIQYYLNNLYEVAVPTFFFISGYLFFLSFQKVSKVTFKDFRVKWMRRSKTLLLPYVLWCFFWVLVLFVIQNIPQLRPYFSSPLDEITLGELITKVLWEPINYPFWFLRELILYVLLSPLLYLLLKYMKVYALILCFIISIFYPYVFIIESFYIIKYFSLFFFLLGSYFSIFSLKLSFDIRPITGIIMLIAWLGLSALELYLRVFAELEFWSLSLINHIMILWGCLTCWVIYDLLDKTYNFQYKKIYAYGFFLFATHGILIVLLTKAILSFFQLNSLGHLLLYILSFLFITTFCIGGGYVFKKIAPKFYYFSTGNR